MLLQPLGSEFASFPRLSSSSGDKAEWNSSKMAAVISPFPHAFFFL